MNNVIDWLKINYANFDGRADRAEYWVFILGYGIGSLAVGFMDGELGTGSMLATIYYLLFLLPGMSVAVRRLHDTDRSGWWILIVLVPLIGQLWFLILMVLPGDNSGNRFGKVPS